MNTLRCAREDNLVDTVRASVDAAAALTSLACGCVRYSENLQPALHLRSTATDGRAQPNHCGVDRRRADAASAYQAATCNRQRNWCGPSFQAFLRRLFREVAVSAAGSAPLSRCAFNARIAACLHSRYTSAKPAFALAGYAGSTSPMLRASADATAALRCASTRHAVGAVSWFRGWRRGRQGADA